MRLNRCRFNTVTTTHQAKFNKRERSQKRVKYVIMHRKVREGSIIILAWFIGPLSWNWIHLVCRNFFPNYQQIHWPRRRRFCGCLVLSDYWTFLASLLSGVMFLTFEPLKRTFLFLRWLQSLLVVACHHQHHHDHDHHHLRHHRHGHLHHLHRHHHLLPFLLFLEVNVVLLFLLLLPLLRILLRFNFLYFWTFYFHFRNSTSLGWTVFNRVIVWFNHLQCILHSGTLATGGVIWWICWWTPRNKVPLTWNL